MKTLPSLLMMIGCLISGFVAGVNHQYTLPDPIVIGSDTIPDNRSQSQFEIGSTANELLNRHQISPEFKTNQSPGILKEMVFDTMEPPEVYINRPIRGGDVLAYTASDRLFIVLKKSYPLYHSDKYRPAHVEIKNDRLIIYRTNDQDAIVRKEIFNLGEQSVEYGRIIPDREIDRWIKWKDQ